MPSECKEMTPKLNVLELSAFQEEISSYPMWSLLQTKIWILFALDYTEEERKNMLSWWEANGQDGFSQWKSVWSLTPRPTNRWGSGYLAHQYH